MEQNTCPECGSNIDENSSVCSFCGKTVQLKKEDLKCDLVLQSVGNQMKAVKIVREAMGLGLQEAMELVKSIPRAVICNKRYEEIESLARKFEEWDCRVTIVESNTDTIIDRTADTWNQNEYDQVITRCPNCFSQNVKKAESGSSGIGRMLSGLFGGKAKNTYQCNDCDYRW